MAQQKIFWSSNVKFLRNRKKISQEEMAAAVGMTRAKINAHESGHSKNPTLEDLTTFSAFFAVAIDTLITVDLSKLGELNLRELLAGNDVYIRGGNLRILSISVDKNNKENTEYVPVKAKAGYASGYSDPDFIAALPKFSLPNLPRSGTFRMFPTTGDSMLPIPENSDVIAQYVENWSTLKPDTPCIVILRNAQDFVFKLVTIQVDGHVLLKSLNPAYEPYFVEANDIIEIWKYYKYQTDTLPEPLTDLQQVKSMIDVLTQKLIK